MSQQLQDTANDALVKLINLATDGVNGAIEFSKQQIPDVIHQLLVWNMVQSLLCFSVGVLFMVVPLSLYLSILKAFTSGKEKDSIWKDYSDEISPLSVITLIVGGFIILMGFAILVNNLDWLQIWLAPKVYLIQYAATLLK